MATKAFLDERRLSKALMGQGFTLEETASGTRVLAPDGQGSAAWHPSMFDEGNVRSYRNMIGQLTRIGFDLEKISTTRDAAKWKAERDELEAMIAEDEQATLDLTEPQDEGPDVDALLATLGPLTAEAFGWISADPGEHPRDYAAAHGVDPSVLASRVIKLRELGLVRTEGQRAAVRWYPAEPEALDAIARNVPASAYKNGKPSAGPVRVRHVEPADRVVRFRKLAERALRLHGELSEVIQAMADGYTAQEAELKELQIKYRDLTGILGRAVDKL